MLSSNITSFLKLLCKDGGPSINRDDEIIRETLVAHGGKIVHPKISDLLAASQSTARGVIV
jgi:hypothetical protein